MYFASAVEQEVAGIALGTQIDYVSVSPLVFLRGVALGGYGCEAVVVAWLACLLLSSCLAIAALERRDVL